MTDYSAEEGLWMVRLAREAARSFLEEGVAPSEDMEIPPYATEKRGAFVTIRTFPGGELRGCIGRPEPKFRLADAIVASAIDSAVRDPRFAPMGPAELAMSTFEVSVLTPPQLLRVKNALEYRKMIKVGRDGLIAEWEMGAGLLLPQVAVEEGWDVDTYLTYVCLKAGAHPDYWLLDKMRLFTFQAVVFGEDAPRGDVKRKELAG